MSTTYLIQNSLIFLEAKSFVYKSDDFETNPNLCVIIHGSGVVRAGQWARRLIMNENLDLGTIMPDIMMAKERGFAILVMNTNDNFRYIHTILVCQIFFLIKDFQKS